MAKIMIIEDEINIRQELMQFLTNSGYETSAVVDFANVVMQVKEQNPDLLLLDVNLPGTNGLLICDQLRRESDIPIIFVTSNRTSMDELECMMRGGDDYIAKPYQMPILIARITAVLRRTRKVEQKDQGFLICKGVRLDTTSAMISYDNRKCELTKNEMKILYCLMKHKGAIIARMDLINYLWDNEVFIDDNTLSVNVTRIRHKLSELGVTDFIETKRGLGYLICD